MAEVEINDLMSIGVIQDEPGYQIPPEGWTLGNNVRYIANGVEALPGWSPTLGANPRSGTPPPAAPACSQVAGGTDGAQLLFVTITYTTAFGETIASSATGFSKSANNLLRVTSPVASGIATGYNVYVIIGSVQFGKQNAVPIPLGSNFTEAVGGFVSSPTVAPTVDSSGEPPMFIMYISSASQPWWLWAGLKGIYVFDGAIDNDITRQTAGVDVPYNAVDAKSWVGTIFQGIPILNNGVDKPQFWGTYSAGTKMLDLTNWPTGLSSKVVRSFLSYMFALNNTSGGVNLPHQVRWSSGSAPGNLPATWDFTDPTNDAGVVDLPDVASGRILDGQELQGQFFIYKEASAWRVQFIGSPFVFSFHSFMENTGILATRCLALTADGQNHSVVTQDDWIIHNGISATSLLSKRMRRYLFNRIDAASYDTSFMFNNPVYDEMWFCYPSTGQSEPDSALIWNYKYNTFSEATGIDFRATEIGTIPIAGTTWAQQTLTWAQDTAPWAGSKRRRIVVANANTRKLILLDDVGTDLRDGLAFTRTLQRTGLSITGQKRSGEWIVDLKNQKMIRVLWPKVQCLNTVNIRVGYAQTINGSVAWNPYQIFNPNSNLFVEGCEGQGRSIAVEFNAQNSFRLDGYKVDLEPLGEF